MGYYATRLSWTIVPALLLIVGIQVQRLTLGVSGRALAVLKVTVIGFTACYVAYWLGKAGPYH
jgi:hypothetical protein